MSFPQIVIGTYEEFVLGYKVLHENEKTNKCKLHQIFASHSHQASVRCVAVYKQIMASSGADENINIYDMIAMKVSSVINYHNSTVTCLEFTPDGSHLVTADQNGDIAIFRCRDWALVKLWKEAHKHANGVTSISVHPSGSLLLTTGADNIVRFWNLIKGRLVYAINFSKKCSIGNFLNFGKWSKNGNFYVVIIGNKMEVYKTTTAALVYEIETDVKIVCAEFIKKSLICLATDNGFVEIHSLIKKELLLKSQAHTRRVKSLASFTIEHQKNYNCIPKSYLVSADSSGNVKLWYLKKKGLNISLLLRGETDCGCRITCLGTVLSADVKEEANEIHESMDAILNNAVETEYEVNVEKPSEVKILKHKTNKKSSSNLKIGNKKRTKNGLKTSKNPQKMKCYGNNTFIR